MMRNAPMIVIRIGRGAAVMTTLGLALLLVCLLLPDRLQAQKAQESFKEKFNIASENGGIAIAASSDGKYVFVVGPGGIMVSDDFGKTGTWVQTVRLK